MEGISNEVLLALLVKKVQDKLSEIPDPETLKGMRGLRGPPGKDFELSEHEATIKAWVKDHALKFSDLTEDQVASLKGKDGVDGKDGKGFNLEEHKAYFVDLVDIMSASAALTFEDFTAEQISELRGAKGRDGLNGKDFSWADHEEKIKDLCQEFISAKSEDLKLKFSDLSVEEISQLRGAKGRDGRDGKDFNFEDHRSFFENLKLSFSELSAEDVSKLKLRFSDLTAEEKNSLKLKLQDMTEDEQNSLRGPRGQRGRQGDQGESIQGERGEPGAKGEQGEPGESIRGLPGPMGMRGVSGQNGVDGVDGEDAPAVTDVRVVQVKNQFYFVFEFSDGSEIKTDSIKLPAPSIYVAGGGMSGGGGDSGGGISFVEDNAWPTPQLVSGEVALSDKPYVIYYLAGDGGPVLGTLPDGDTLQRIELVGTSDTDTVEFDNDTNIQVSGAAVLKLGSRITFAWIDGLNKWVEVARNEIL